jgi:hypothetical protein
MQKIKWKVDSVPTGMYRSFARRSWPTADYPSGQIAALITCSDEYEPRNVRAGNHGPLIVRVADYSVQPWKWRKMVSTFRTLPEAKAGFAKLLVKYPSLSPLEPGK